MNTRKVSNTNSKIPFELLPIGMSFFLAGALMSKNCPFRGFIFILLFLFLGFMELLYHNEEVIKHMKSVYDQIWESAMRKLEIRPHSKAELISKLNEKFGGDRGSILKVIEEMERVQLLNDRRFAEEFIHHLIQKNIGRLKIYMETRKRGLGNDLVDQMLENEEWSEDEAVNRAIKEKERVLNEKDERKKKMKIINFLKNRGFRDSVIFQNVK